MKSDRLLALLLLLQTHGQLSATDLAERLEVSVRTVFRDVEALSSAGVPVYSERGRNGGIALLPGFRTDVTGLTADEARSLFVLLADRTHADLGLGQAIGSALRKVMAALPESHRDAADLVSRRILVDPVRWRTGPRPTIDLGALQEAVFTDRRLRLRYRRGEDSRVHDYTVDPYGLVDTAGVWYLVADHRARPRMFRADRVVSARVADEPVQRRRGVELADVWEELRRNIDEAPAQLPVVVRVRRKTLGRFLRLHQADLAGPPPPGVLEEDGSEWTELELRFRELGAARPLLAFGTSVEVISPPELREELARVATDIAALYRA
ncbi:helix-turn-helix transcriptional regulator [Streptomyces diastatochromogenes]|uniref:DNA-binding transcriptional regulator n=1 Tax=Streptomyces diastatochromogenes TaxID=42236 RepID=A0A233RRS8_STRDA|nr:WYL domain-containing protein [Streptomyces diastatochromogenes]MCZ0984738.1 WYL domain-containing protein [Streptomyces diastatochromogenes]OXY86095.1 DNA-binding transcriptional regulator [Streptomyces diastatochromogenes]